MTGINASLAALLLLGSIFEVRPLSGTPQRGVLKRLDEKKLVLSADAGDQTLSLREIGRVTRVDAPQRNSDRPLPITLYLTDGGVWKLASVRLADGRLEVVDGFAKSATTRFRAVKALRLTASEANLDGAWEEFLRAGRGADALILRRTVTRKAEDGETVIGSETTLDAIDGKLIGIDDAAVKFEVEGEAVDIPRRRVEGVVLATPERGETPDAIALAVDVYGSRWNLQHATIQNQTLSMQAVCGVAAELPLDQLLLLDFSASNTRYLSDLEMVGYEVRPYLDASFTGDKLAKMLAPRRDKAFFGAPLEERESPFDEVKGLALVAYSRVQYRVPRGFDRFRAEAALDPRVKKVGGVVLRILVDDREIYSKAIEGEQSSDAIDLRLPPQARMLTVEVDFGSRKDLGANLQLRGARFTK